MKVKISYEIQITKRLLVDLKAKIPKLKLSQNTNLVVGHEHFFFARGYVEHNDQSCKITKQYKWYSVNIDFVSVKIKLKKWKEKGGTSGKIKAKKLLKN